MTAGMGDEELDKGTRFIFNILGYIHVPAFILFLWRETFCSWEFEYLSSIVEGKTCKAYILELREQMPVKTMCVGAYHLETRQRTYTYTGAN